jgi:3-hydroxy-D-aspartate aldolase
LIQVKQSVDLLKAAGLECDVDGGGTGSILLRKRLWCIQRTTVWILCVLDADYGRILDKDGNRIDQGEWENARCSFGFGHEPIR